MKLNYTINNKKISVYTPDSTEFFRGEDLCLSKEGEDITKNSDWYDIGYNIYDLSSIIKYEDLLDSITIPVKKIIHQTFPDINLENFSLSKYHKFLSMSQHLLIDKKLKRLYPKDFGFNDDLIVKFIGNKLKKTLSYQPSYKKLPHWIIVRISMPKTSGSKGFNPAHKDIYEDYDQLNNLPKMVNAWIPICGVNEKTGLGIVPGSHLLKENAILRTKCGAILEGQKYSVNCIKSWGEDTSLKIISPPNGSMLIFSSYLIHGMAINNNTDETRVSLEFRLHQD